MLSAAAAAARAYSGPYPTWPAPTPEQARQVAERLATLHGWPSARRARGPQVGCEERRSVLDSLVRTLLSQNTTDATSGRAFAALKQRFPSWQAVLRAPAADVADAIRVGGLADIKAARIQAILQALAAERGQLSLEHLRDLPPAAVKAELGRFKGVGPKTIACVQLFALGRDDFAVDTHVWEITKALGWVPLNASRDQAYEHLNALVPDGLKYDLHVQLVNHGKVCPACAKAGSAKAKGAAASGAAAACPLADLKPPLSQLQKAAPARQRAGSSSGKKAGGSGKGKAAAGGEAAVDGSSAAAAGGGGGKRRKVAAADAEVKVEVKVEATDSQ